MPKEISHPLPDGWSVEVFRTVKQIESIRSVWEEMQANQLIPSIFADIDRYLCVIKTSGNDTSPFVLLLKKNNQPQAMVVSRREKHTVPIRLGYKTIFKPKLDSLTVVYGGVLGQPDRCASNLLIQSLLRLLNEKEVDLIYFNHLKTDSEFYTQFCQSSSFLRQNHFRHIQPHRRMSIPDNINDFFQKLSKKHRANLKRTIRNLEDKYADNIEMKVAQKDDFESFAQDAEKISHKTYQHAIYAGFSNTSLMNAILTTDAEKQRLMLAILYIDQLPCAFQWGTVSNNTYYLEKIGFDPDWAKASVGNVLFVKVLEKLCTHYDAHYIDFGFGDAQYKQSYGDESWQEAAATYLFAPRFYPLLINLVNTVNSAVTIGLLWMTKKIGLFGWLKRTWRQRLQKNAKTSNISGQ